MTIYAQSCTQHNTNDTSQDRVQHSVSTHTEKVPSSVLTKRGPYQKKSQEFALKTQYDNVS